MPASQPVSSFPSRPEVIGSLPAAPVDRSVSVANPSELGGVAMSNPTGLGGVGGLYMGGQPEQQDDRIAAARDAKTQQSQVADGPFGDETDYIDDETVPIGTTPTAPAAPTSLPGATAATPKAGLGEQVLAGGIDILGGMIPGVGMGVSLANAGLMVMGKPSIGQSLAHDILHGDRSTVAMEKRSERGEGYSGPASKRFASKYMGSGRKPDEPESQVDNSAAEATIPYVKRPTPKERFIDARDVYGAAA
jgi:hypothetical protein